MGGNEFAVCTFAGLHFRLCADLILPLSSPCFLPLSVHAQVQPGAGRVLLEKVAPAPASVFKKFREAGMDPVDHPLTAVEWAKVEAAFAVLPALHQKILATHLKSVSFMDNMPNTALTSPVAPDDSSKMFNITFRAGVLHETISAWATKKENTLFEWPENSVYTISVEAGTLDAFIYILLHEANADDR
jgi:hypothetical protein